MKLGLRFWVLAAVASVATLYMVSPMLSGVAGLKVVSIGSDAACGNLRVGDVITGLGGIRMPTAKDFETATDAVKPGDRVALVVNGGPGGCTAIADGDLGIDVEGISRGWIRLGADVAGGEKFVVRAPSLTGSETLDYIAGVLKKRLDVIGIKDSYAIVEDGVIGVYLPRGDSVNSVVFPGELKGVARQELPLRDGAAKTKIGNDTYSISWNGVTASFGGASYGVGDTFELGGVETIVMNFTNASLTVDEVIFDNSGIARLEGGQEHVAYNSESMSYVYSVPTTLSDAASKRFSDVVGGLEPLYGASEGMLNGVLIYSVDGEELSRLSIPTNILDYPVKDLSITGGERDMGNAVYKKELFSMALYGRISSPMETSDAGAFGGAMGWAAQGTELFVVAFMIALFVVVFVMHRNFGLAAFAMAVPAIEIFMVLAVAQMSQSLAEQGWIIDFMTLAGICVLAALSSAQTAVLTEKAVKSRFSKFYAGMSAAAIAVGMVLSFTQFNRFGLAIAFGGILGYAVVKPFYEEFAAKFRR